MFNTRQTNNITGTYIVLTASFRQMFGLHRCWHVESTKLTLASF